MNSRTDLRLAWVSHHVAKYAVRRWHYSRRLSSARNAYIGVWEDDRFIGVVVFGVGSGNVTNGRRYGLAKSHEMAELTRIALAPHMTAVSRILSIAVKMIRRRSPNLRLLISMADQAQGHHGGVYQAAGWIYTGETKPDVEYFYRGRWRHHRTVTSAVSAQGLPSRSVAPKYRYLLPLTSEVRQLVIGMGRPYSKRQKDSSEPATFQVAEGGAAPTLALQHFDATGKTPVLTDG